MSRPDDPPPTVFGPDLFNGRLWAIQIRNAASYLTRIPAIRRSISDEAGLPTSAARAFPIVGAALGLFGGLAYGLGALLGFPSLIAALLGVGAAILVAGARPEEALSRLAEGFGHGRGTEQKLSIMNETPIGTVGVITLLLAVGAKVGAIADLASVGLVIAAMVTASTVSRAAIPFMARYLDPVESADDTGSAARPAFADLLVGGGLVLVLALVVLGWSGLIATVAAVIGVVGFSFLVKRQIGGHTVEVLGSTQQVAEVAFLIILAALR